jgi:hypothetical protein
MRFCWMIGAVGCSVDEPPAQGVQYGDEGVIIPCIETTEPWDPDDLPDTFVEAPSATRDRAMGSWSTVVTESVVGAFDLVVELQPADGDVTLLRPGPTWAGSPFCFEYVEVPVTAVVDGGAAVQGTFSGRLEIARDQWILRTKTDRASVYGALAASSALSGFDEVVLEGRGEDEGLQGNGPVQALLAMGVPPQPNPWREGWADFVLER